MLVPTPPAVGESSCFSLALLTTFMSTFLMGVPRVPPAHPSGYRCPAIVHGLLAMHSSWPGDWWFVVSPVVVVVCWMFYWF
jgi:hypothetical protein